MDRSSSTRIKILPPEVANKIAAGEVVERPASVVKELVENSIDADANEITIILNQGGKDLIQVVDDGVGMNAEDLKLAFQRHATSKIQQAADLEGITTLGFRGEALASIASVSRIEARSIERGQISGTLLILEGGRLMEEKPTGGPPGTSIAVKTLFFNTPARRKFLRADSTEYRHCLTTANRFALAYPEKSFTLVHHGEVIWEVRSQPLKERICEILGRRLEKLLIEVNEDAGAVQIEGYVGTQDTVRRQSGEQFLFLNGRYIYDRSLHHAIVSAYGEILAHGGYPLYVLHLSIDPTRVDVNVHPTKMEVKFADDRLIYSLVRGAIKRALASAKVIPDLQAPGSSFPDQPAATWLKSNWQSSSGPASQPAVDSGGSARQGTPIQPVDLYAPPESTQGQQPLPFQEEKSPETEPVPFTPAGGESAPTMNTQANVWQLHNRYILTQIDSGLIIIDQHVAHERILYEKALRLFEEARPSTQKILFPRMIELSAEDYDILQEILPFLEKLGFMIQDFGKHTVVVEGIPAGTRIKNYTTLLQEMIDDYRRGKRNNLEIRDNIARSYACHTAIRSGDPLNIHEMNALIEQLFKTETPYFCPHGRPVLVNISLEELDKRFGRT